MAKSDYMPPNDTGKGALFLHVAVTLPTFFTRLAISPATTQVMAQAADAAAFDYTLRGQQVIIAAGQEATAAKNRLRDGDPEKPNLAVNLAFPGTPGVAPTAVTPGVVTRFRLFVAFLNGLTGFAEDIAQALKITGSQQTGPDTATVKPLLPLILQGGHVFVDWGWGGFGAFLDALEMHVDRGDGRGFVLLTIDTRPGYLDTEPMPAAPGRWKYKGIFRKDDQRVGLWSDVAEAAVG